ncbi:MAG: twin-arginine translocation signal domain-containing protein, partial [bacterium]
MATGKIKLITRRDALAMLGAAGALGLVGYGESHGDEMNASSTPVRLHRDSNRKFKTIGVLGGLG